VLDGPLLKYYKGEGKDGQPSPDELKGAITLTGCEVKEKDVDGAPTVFGFEISPVSKKIFYICADDDEARSAWIAAVRTNSVPGVTVGPSSSNLPVEVAEPDPRDVRNVALGGSQQNVTLGDFELLKVIGRGTYGKVMQVRLRHDNEIYAMKVLKKENIFARDDPKDLQHTIAERNVLALLNNQGHPFILGLIFAFHTPAKLYYVLDFCNGGDLYYLLSRCKKFKESQARFYSGEVFLAIQHLHSLGVIYRDLKPENVLLDSSGHVKLTDFGLSKESQTADTFCGTPVYLAPEIWMHKTYGYAVDWWSLGCVLYEMVCGLPPFWGDTIKDVYKKVIHTRPKFPAMSPECQSVIEGLLTREADQRLGTADNGADIKKHPFFLPQNWDDLYAKAIKPPFKSKSSNQEDTNNFHKAFTNQRPVDSLANASHLNDAQQANFEGFTYIPSGRGSLTNAVSEAEADLEALGVDGRASQRRGSQYTQPS